MKRSVINCILRAKVPFKEGEGSKEHPVLVLSKTKGLVLSLKMTSHEPRYKSLEGEYEMMKWKEAGLSKPTVIQCSKVLSLLETEVKWTGSH